MHDRRGHPPGRRATLAPIARSLDSHGVAVRSARKGRLVRSFIATTNPRTHMKIARNLILAGIAWGLIARRRAALARDRRARRMAPLLVTAGAAGGAGLILAARPRILEGARRLWDLARPTDEKRMGIRAPQRDAESELTERTESLRQQGQRASSVGPRSTSNTHALAATERNPGVRRRKRTSRAKQTAKGGRKSAYGVKPQGEDRSEPASDPGESLKH